MKANPYVYPSDNFQYLLKTGRRTVVQDTGAKSLDYFINLLWPLFDFKVKTNESKKIEEQILELFTDDRVCYGDKKNILVEKNNWIKKLKESIKNRSINLTILGFPFKIPVQLKTDRKLPDAGELASMLSLLNIIKNVERISGISTKVNIFAEEGFAEFIDLPKNYAQKYFEYLLMISQNKFFQGKINVVRISDMEKDKRFNSIFSKNITSNMSLFKKSDKKYMGKYRNTAPIVFRIINTLGYDDTILEETYSSKKNNQISTDGVKVRNFLDERLPLCIAKYFAYLKTRDELNYLERVVKNPLTLSVSPKPGRLGVFPISRTTTKLPYHGVPVLDIKNKRFYIDYLIDLKKGGGKYKGLKWNKDFDIGYFLYTK